MIRSKRLESGEGEMKQRIGFVGVGLMGGWLARHLLSAGFSVTAHDIDPESGREKSEVSRSNCRPGGCHHPVAAQFKDRERCGEELAEIIR
jgi:UDP-N-acetylmuramoylalanine-D-glutamate ligase